MPVVAMCPAANDLVIAVNCFENMKAAIAYYEKLDLPVTVKSEKLSIVDISCINGDRDDDEDLLKKLFKDGDYDSCGDDANVIELKEVKFGKPFASYSLD